MRTSVGIDRSKLKIVSVGRAREMCPLKAQSDLMEGQEARDLTE